MANGEEKQENFGQNLEFHIFVTGATLSVCVCVCTFNCCGSAVVSIVYFRFMHFRFAGISMQINSVCAIFLFGPGHLSRQFQYKM